MHKGVEIARGKTKVLYEMPEQPAQLIVTQTDAISAGDGARRHEIAGKGRLASQTTARVFRLLNLCGLPTHYLNGGEDDDDNEMVVRRCNMIPLEVVTRGVAAGSFVKRNPSVAGGMLLVPRVVEFFLKDDAHHDPLISADDVAARSIAAPHELAMMTEMARLTFDILSHAWRRRDVLLVDLKIEFGRIASGEQEGQLAIADVIDNDSWRIWPQGREELMLDKQMYRNLDRVDETALSNVKRAYERVADFVGTFPVMRPGMVAAIADVASAAKRIEAVASALGGLGIPVVRHVANPATTPGYVLQLVQQLEASFPRLVLVALSDRDLLREMLDAAASSPVLDGAGDPARLAMQCAKVFGLEDTVLYGRALLLQANARSSVVAADAALQAPAPPPGIAIG